MTAADAWKMCAPCGAEWDAWLDTRPSTLLSRAAGFTFGSGAAYDVTPVGIRENRAARHERWRVIVRDHQRAIGAACRAGNHSAPRLDTSQSSL